MYKFSSKSKDALSTCHPDIIKVCERVIQDYDFSVIEGYRDRERQDKMVAEGFSQLYWPGSYHNKWPSRAVDIIPYPTGYDVIEEFFVLATHVYKVCLELDVKLEWGGHWESFKDYPHWQLVEIKDYDTIET